MVLSILLTSDISLSYQDSNLYYARTAVTAEKWIRLGANVNNREVYVSVQDKCQPCYSFIYKKYLNAMLVE